MWTQSVENADNQVVGSKKCKCVDSISVYINASILVKMINKNIMDNIFNELREVDAILEIVKYN